MSPLLIEAEECRATWRSGDAILHVCTLTPGHSHAHQCYCGLVSA